MIEDGLNMREVNKKESNIKKKKKKLNIILFTVFSSTFQKTTEPSLKYQIRKVSPSFQEEEKQKNKLLSRS